YRPLGLVAEIFPADPGAIRELAAQGEDPLRLRLSGHVAGALDGRLRQAADQARGAAADPQGKRRPAAEAQVTLRPATPADARAVAACVEAAYEHYVVRIGKRPGPMLDDYDEVLRQHRAFVLEDERAIVAVCVFIAEPGRALLDNVAVLPQFQG